jgi:hypothetical protein
MGRRAGSADLPLHGGHVPRWLSEGMTRLGTVISEAITHDAPAGASLLVPVVRRCDGHFTVEIRHGSRAENDRFDFAFARQEPRRVIDEIEGKVLRRQDPEQPCLIGY